MSEQHQCSGNCDCRPIALAELMQRVAQRLQEWAQAQGGRLTLAESPRAALDVLLSGQPVSGFSAALFFEGDRSQAEYVGDTQTEGTLTVALLRHPGLQAEKMQSHIKGGSRPALLTIIDGLRRFVRETEFEFLPNGILEYESARYLQLEEGAMANGYALTYQFTYFQGSK